MLKNTLKISIALICLTASCSSQKPEQELKSQTITAAQTTKQTSLEEAWNLALHNTVGPDETFFIFESEVNAREVFTWTPCSGSNSIGGAHPTYMGGVDAAYSIANRVLTTLNRNRDPNDHFVLDNLDVACSVDPVPPRESQLTEELWNSALLAEVGPDETFLIFESEVNAREIFTWTPCSESNSIGGAHPTYMGGVDAAYSIANRVLTALNRDRDPDDQFILDDLNVTCSVDSGVE